MTAPWLDDGDVRLYHGDAAAVLRSLPAGIAQTCVTSPPYWGLRDYGTGSWTGGDTDCDHALPKQVDRKFTNGRGEGSGDAYAGSNLRSWTTRDGTTYGAECGKCGARRVDDQLGLEATPDLYVERLVQVMREVWRCLREDGTLWLNLGDSYANLNHAPGSTQDNSRVGGNSAERWGGIKLNSGKIPPGLKAKDLVGVPWRVAFALQADGWYLRSDIIWAKPNPMPESVTDRPTKAHEYVFLLAKQPKYYWDADAIREAATPDGIAREGRARLSAYDAPGQTANRRTTSDGAWLEAGRNARSVWEVATQPTPEAHFATYPEALVRRCILAGTSEAGGCSVCGAPYERQVERGHDTSSADSAVRTAEVTTTTAQRKLGAPYRRQMAEHPPQTTGWTPSCACGVAPATAGAEATTGTPVESTTRQMAVAGGAPVPQLVLDPFVGSGTTMLVARKHGRRAIGIDLSEEYLAIAARRTAQLSLLGEGAA